MTSELEEQLSFTGFSFHRCPHDCDSLQQEDVEHNQQREKVPAAEASRVLSGSM